MREDMDMTGGQTPQPTSTRDRQAMSVLPIALTAAIALVAAAAALTMALVGSGTVPAVATVSGRGPAMMGSGAGALRGNVAAPVGGPQPGEAGFVAGTAAAPRVVDVEAGPGYAFRPASIAVVRGETITFRVTTMGPLTHEFMVGPANAVAADTEGTPEVADIAMMQTKSITYTFDGDGPYAFACHAPGHDEAGMRGTIVVVAP
jgi:uncharacterized cupredoxin-like copper-binding protein